jgi:hypothetical protein
MTHSRSPHRRRDGRAPRGDPEDVHPWPAKLPEHAAQGQGISRVVQDPCDAPRVAFIEGIRSGSGFRAEAVHAPAVSGHRSHRDGGDVQL